VPIFVDRECCVVSTTDPYGRILGFIDRSLNFFFQVASQLYSRGWMGPVPDPLLLRKSGGAENRTRDLWVCSQEHNGSLRPYSRISRPKPLLSLPSIHSRGVMDPVPDPSFLRKSSRAWNQTRYFWVCSQELWPLEHRYMEELKLKRHFSLAPWKDLLRINVLHVKLIPLGAKRNICPYSYYTRSIFQLMNSVL
jgi:hypothetical protein